MHIRNCFSSIVFFEHIQLGITTLASWIKFQIDKSDIKLEILIMQRLKLMTTS